MKLFILGNGFDLAHGIESEYNHFRDYLENKYLDFLITFEKNYGIGIDTMPKVRDSILWKEFESNLSYINWQEIFDSAVDSAMQITLDDGSQSGTDDGLSSYLENEYSYIKKLNDYITEWAESIDINVPKAYKKTLWNKEDLFLSFNYTRVLEEVYKIDPSNILHIHGSVDKEKDGDPVIGHGNKQIISEMRNRAAMDDENYRPKQASAYRAIANYLETTLKDVSFYCNINNSFFNSKIKNVSEVYIIGHSMGEVDIPYFKKIKENIKSDAIWLPVWYNEEDQKRFKEILLGIGIPEKYIVTINSKDCTRN